MKLLNYFMGWIAFSILWCLAFISNVAPYSWVFAFLPILIPLAIAEFLFVLSVVCAIGASILLWGWIQFERLAKWSERG